MFSFVFFLSVSSFLLNVANAFVCDSNMISNNALLHSTFSYDNTNKIIQTTYTYPINMIEYIDYTNQLKYKLCTSDCDAEIYNIDFPKLYKLDTDTLIKAIDNTYYYSRNGDFITSYTMKNNFITSINYTNGDYQEFYNCNNNIAVKPDLSICPQPICSKIADIIFVIDESGSIIEEEFNKIKSFIIDMINYYDLSADTVNVGIVLFAESSRIVSELSYNKNNLITLIDNMAQYKGGTCISCGLDTAISMLNSKSNYRKSLNPENIIITLTDGEANKPVKNNHNKRYYDQNHCTSYGNCKNSCTDNSTIYYQKCSDFCPNKNKNRCSSNTCYIYQDGLWYYDIRNNKCNINNYVYRNDCCVNGADPCCCESVPVIGGCWSGDYNSDALPKSANNIKLNNITSIAIGVRDASISQLKSFSDNVYGINSYTELANLKKSLISDTCTSINYTSCNKECKGFCGCSKKCYCPECVDTKNTCEYYQCKNNDYSSTGCIKEYAKCDYSNKCLNVIRNNTINGCCVYTEKECKPSNKCKTASCSPIYGCYSNDVNCDDLNPCTIDSCDPEYGCIHVPNTNICKENEVCIALNSKEYKCSDDCNDGASCGEDNACGSWSCENHKCIYTPKCIPDNCHTLIKCDPTLTEPCIYEEIKCKNPDNCHINGKCIDGKCIYENKTCPQTNYCKYGKCDSIYGCLSYDVDCNNGDLCVNYSCVSHPEWENYTCEYTDKCPEVNCMNVKCSITGECIYSDVICNISDSCFTYSCVNNSCVRDILNQSSLDPCGKCIEEYHALGYYLDYNKSLCEGNHTGFKLDIALISAGAIAAIVIGCVVAAALISFGSVKGVQELIKRTNAANNIAAHTNPLYEPNGSEMTNPMYI